MAAGRNSSTRVWRACALIAWAVPACSGKLAAPLVPAPARAPTAALAAEASAHHHVLRLPPVGPAVPEPRATPPQCSAADWTPRTLAPLLTPGKVATPAQPDQQSARVQVFDSECTDSPAGPTEESPTTVVVSGVELRLASATPAGSSKRGWAGNQCSFDVQLADGSGRPTRLGAPEIPPFTTVNALVRSGSALWLAVSFNGYTKEFPKGGNRIVALDLCEGRVVWTSKDSLSNGGLLLLGDYLISAYGFTAEPRYVFVLDAHSGRTIQKLPVIENICPSKSWAPNWHPGDACDPHGQRVGAAENPRVEGGLFLVDTNTGSSAFQFK